MWNSGAVFFLLGTQLVSSLSGMPTARITHGPILGRLGAHQIAVWARTAQPATFRVRYGLQANQLQQLSPPVTTQLEKDNTGWVFLRGLKANTKYYYRVEGLNQDGGPTPAMVGSFLTLPDPEDVHHPEYNPQGLFNFSFEFACGNSQTGVGPELPAFRTMLDKLKDRIFFAIQNGDWLYEDRRDYSTQQWLRQVQRGQQEMPRVVRYAPSIVGVWENYKVYLERGKNLATWHRMMPSFFTFDDHEILDDVYGAGSAGRRHRRTVFRDIGVQAWYDYLGWSNPLKHTQEIHFGQAKLKAGHDVLVDAEADFRRLDLSQAANLHVHWGGPNAGVDDRRLDELGGDPNAGVYDIREFLSPNRLRISPPARADGTVSYSIGRLSYFQMGVSNCDFFFLDTRTHREMHDINHPAQPGLSMLGARQKSWLMKAMANSKADFLFVVSSVNLMVPHVAGGSWETPPANKDDAWTVFLDEREQLIRFWDSLGKPVFVLTGDLHNSFVIKITDRVWEFASGPHNSANHLTSDEAHRPANGRFDSLGRKCEIRWSSYFRDEISHPGPRYPLFCVVQVNNVFNNPPKVGEEQWVAFPHPQVIFQYYDGLTGELRYAEAILGRR